MVQRTMRVVLAGWWIAVFCIGVYADDTFEKLFASGKYNEAIEYADNNIPAPSRTSDIWVKLGEANEKLNLMEKALACYLVSWRMTPTHYGSLLGAAKIYNKLNQYENALEMSKKALEQNFTGDASWEYARACIALKRPAEARKALEKVIETAPDNIVANRELGGIYFNDRQFDKAIPLLKKALDKKADAEIALKVGQSYKEMEVVDSALAYIEKAIASGLTRPDVILDLAVVYYKRNDFAKAVDKFDNALSAKARLTAEDHYMRAVAREKTNDAGGSLAAYRAAVAAFGSSAAPDALQARLKVGKAEFAAKKFSDALEHFKFIQAADKDAKAVSDIYFLLADTYQEMKDTPAAISSLEKAIAGDTKNYEAYARLAELYESSGQAAKAKQTYETMMALSPDDPKVYLVLGQYNFKAKKYTEALDLFTKGNGLKASAEAQEGIAMAAMELNQWNKAREAALGAVRLDRSVIESRKILAKVYLRGKEYGDARGQLEFLVGKEPNNREYWISLAECYDALKATEKLADADRKIIGLDRNNVESRIRLAAYLKAQGKETDAYDLYRQAALLDSKNSDAQLNLFLIARGQNKKADATTHLTQYLSLKPGDAERYRDLGDLYYEQKNFDGALNAYRKAIQLDPGISGFYKRYAEVVIAKGQEAEVIGALSKLIEAGDAELTNYTTLGMIYEKQNQHRKALDIYQKALVLDPQNSDVLLALASCQAATGDINGAIITYEQAVMMNPNAADGYKSLGDLYVKQKKDDQAMKAYMNYLDRNPGDEEIARNVGMRAYREKKYAEAMKYLGMVKGKEANDFNHLYSLAESAFLTEKFDIAAPIFEQLRKRSPNQNTMKNVTKMLAESYEKMGKNLDAARAYNDYASLPGVKDADASYKSAVLQEKANPRVAEKIYKENIKNFPQDCRSYVKLGLMYSQDKNTLSESVALLKKAASLASDMPEVWLELAKVYGELGKIDDELKAYTEYSKTNPQNDLANKRMGIILIGKGKTTEGLVYLETANAISPNDPDILAALAEGYVRTNRDKEAIDLLVKLRTMKSGDPEIRLRLFELYRKTGKMKDAEQEIKQLIELKRDNVFLLAYARLLFDKGDFKNAENTAEDILATDPENLQALMLKGSALRAQKKYDDAVEAFKEVAFIDPNNAPALYERAETHRLQGKPQWAVTFYTRALRADPTFALAEFGMALIAKAAKNKEEYLSRLKAARALDPHNSQIREEWEKAPR